MAAGEIRLPGVQHHGGHHRNIGMALPDLGHGAAADGDDQAQVSIVEGQGQLACGRGLLEIDCAERADGQRSRDARECLGVLRWKPLPAKLKKPPGPPP